VPPERQKLMSKAWKLALKDDASLAGMADLKDGLAVTLMGSADAVAKPVEKTVRGGGHRACSPPRSPSLPAHPACCKRPPHLVLTCAHPYRPPPPRARAQVFVEDLPASASVNAGLGLPAGLANLGNTCYANSTLEALRAVPELATSLVAYKTGAGGRGSAAATSAAASSSSQPAAAPSPYGPVVSGLADLMGQLGGSRAAVAPSPFLTKVRAVFPRFAEQGQFGVFKQQDADEFYVELMRALAAELTHPTPSVPALSHRPGSASAANVIDTLFGVPLEQSYKCLESDAEPPSTRFDFAHKLPCNIDGGAGRTTQVNHLHEGVMLGLTETVTKEAAALGRNAQWSKTSRLAATPRYLCVQVRMGAGAARGGWRGRAHVVLVAGPPAAALPHERAASTLTCLGRLPPTHAPFPSFPAGRSSCASTGRRRPIAATTRASSARCCGRWRSPPTTWTCTTGAPPACRRASRCTATRTRRRPCLAAARATAAAAAVTRWR
jgi:hypothetical protein